MTHETIVKAILLGTLISVSMCHGTDHEKPEVSIGALSISRAAPEPYDITPYIDKSWEVLEEISTHHRGHSTQDETRFTPLTPDVDEDWKIMCDIYQELIRRDQRSVLYLNNDFTYKRAGMRFMKDKSPPHLFFRWKQAAWVNPDDAEGLAYVLMHGFQDKIPPCPQWAPYWIDRSKLLRESRGWYIPVDSTPSPSIEEGLTDMQKINILLGL